MPGLLQLAAIGPWWRQQMRALLGLEPAPAPDAVIIEVASLEGASPRLRLRRNGRETELPSAPPPRLPLLLRLPEACLLSRALSFPRAAAQDLPSLLRFEMDRLTPFSPDELLWGVSDLVHDPARESVSLRLTIVPRAPVEAMLTRLGQSPGWIEHRHGRIPLGERPARRLRAWPALCAGLALACVVVPFVRQQLALDDAAALIAARAPAAQAAQHLRARLQQQAAGLAAIAAARRQGDPAQILAALTDALPDDTYLSDLTLKAGSLTIDGQSGNAAGLIARLAAVPGLQDPSFTAPVTRSNDGTSDLFSLHAGVAP